VERQHIELVLQEENGHVERAAGRLGIPRSSLYQKIKQLGLRPVAEASVAETS
jgi:DNA-binding NtrC family response regulator